eukprot:6147454-Amphidinium_carterae.1
MLAVVCLWKQGVRSFLAGIAVALAHPEVGILWMHFQGNLSKRWMPKQAGLWHASDKHFHLGTCLTPPATDVRKSDPEGQNRLLSVHV